MAKKAKPQASNLTMSMFASKSDLEAARAEEAQVSPPEFPRCMICKHSTLEGTFTICKVRLPPFVKLVERASTRIVNPDDVCALYEQGF